MILTSLLLETVGQGKATVLAGGPAEGHFNNMAVAVKDFWGGITHIAKESFRTLAHNLHDLHQGETLVTSFFFFFPWW